LGGSRQSRLLTAARQGSQNWQSKKANFGGKRCMNFRMAKPVDAELVATLNALLIRDEGHRNLMTVPQLATRMSDWLCGDYQAVLFEELDAVVGYALFRREPEYVYLRQIFVRPDFRRRGIGRAAMEWLSVNAWQGAPRFRIEVLIGNEIGQAFWRAVGFRDYSVTMEREPMASLE
jgi:ribosomal protein S18 acetylase RimI-like enzyme